MEYNFIFLFFSSYEWRLNDTEGVCPQKRTVNSNNFRNIKLKERKKERKKENKLDKQTNKKQRSKSHRYEEIFSKMMTKK